MHGRGTHVAMKPLRLHDNVPEIEDEDDERGVPPGLEILANRIETDKSSYKTLGICERCWVG